MIVVKCDPDFHVLSFFRDMLAGHREAFIEIDEIMEFVGWKRWHGTEVQ